MTSEKLNELNKLQRELEIRRKNFDVFEKCSDESYVSVVGYGKVCNLTPIEFQMIKTRLQMELQELEKEFEAL